MHEAPKKFMQYGSMEKVQPSITWICVRKLDADGKGDPKNILLNGGLMAIYDGRK